jgi:predicted lipoprotein with Yx(FWY)xxD motif
MEWLPVLVSEKIKFENLDPAKLGAMARPDGTQQVTVGGWPVYRYADDKVPGQISGQGADGLWFVVAPDGAKAAAPTTQLFDGATT